MNHSGSVSGYSPAPPLPASVPHTLPPHRWCIQEASEVCYGIKHCKATYIWQLFFSQLFSLGLPRHSFQNDNMQNQAFAKWIIPTWIIKWSPSDICLKKIYVICVILCEKFNRSYQKFQTKICTVHTFFSNTQKCFFFFTPFWHHFLSDHVQTKLYPELFWIWSPGHITHHIIFYRPFWWGQVGNFSKLSS